MSLELSADAPPPGRSSSGVIMWGGRSLISSCSCDRFSLLCIERELLYLCLIFWRLVSVKTTLPTINNPSLICKKLKTTMCSCIYCMQSVLISDNSWCVSEHNCKNKSVKACKHNNDYLWNNNVYLFAKQCVLFESHLSP